MAQKLNNRLNYQPRDDRDDDDDIQEETQHKYEEELDINDFPQAARYYSFIFLFFYNIRFLLLPLKKNK